MDVFDHRQAFSMGMQAMMAQLLPPLRVHTVADMRRVLSFSSSREIGKGTQGSIYLLCINDGPDKCLAVSSKESTMAAKTRTDTVAVTASAWAMRRGTPHVPIVYAIVRSKVGVTAKTTARSGVSVWMFMELAVPFPYYRTLHMFTAEEQRSMFMQGLHALVVMEAYQVVHRDLQVQNMLYIPVPLDTVFKYALPGDWLLRIPLLGKCVLVADYGHAHHSAPTTTGSLDVRGMFGRADMKAYTLPRRSYVGTVYQTQVLVFTAMFPVMHQPVLSFFEARQWLSPFQSVAAQVHAKETKYYALDVLLEFGRRFGWLGREGVPAAGASETFVDPTTQAFLDGVAADVADWKRTGKVPGAPASASEAALASASASLPRPRPRRSSRRKPQTRKTPARSRPSRTRRRTRRPKRLGVRRKK